MNTASFATIFDPEDTRKVDMVLKGINVGQYRNDVFSKWNMTLDIAIASYELYFCNRLGHELGMQIENSDDVLVAQRVLQEKTGKTIPEWAEDLMDNETDKELLKENGF